MIKKLTNCNLCPRECHINRAAGQRGVCGAAGEEVLVARAALHMWEEPCISGERGSGAVFFCGCPLHCVYCQNESISRGKMENAGTENDKTENDKSENAKIGKRISTERLAELFLELQEQKAANINLVTPTHYTPQIIRAVERARTQGLVVPIVYNCSGYEKVDTLKMLEGIVDVYLTDFKYMESELAKKYSKATDYPQVAMAALAEMVRQVNGAVFDVDGMMRRGVIVRHLLLPGHLRNAKGVVRYVYETYGNQVFLSLMNQYTPMLSKQSIFEQNGWHELNRRVTKREYESLVDYAISRGVENGFIQEGETAAESFIPAFDNEGV